MFSSTFPVLPASRKGVSRSDAQGRKIVLEVRRIDLRVRKRALRSRFGGVEGRKWAIEGRKRALRPRRGRDRRSTRGRSRATWRGSTFPLPSTRRRAGGRFGRATPSGHRATGHRPMGSAQARGRRCRRVGSARNLRSLVRAAWEPPSWTRHSGRPGRCRSVGLSVVVWTAARERSCNVPEEVRATRRGWSPRPRLRGRLDAGLNQAFEPLWNVLEVASSVQPLPDPIQRIRVGGSSRSNDGGSFTPRIRHAHPRPTEAPSQLVSEGDTERLLLTRKLSDAKCLAGDRRSNELFDRRRRA